MARAPTASTAPPDATTEVSGAWSWVSLSYTQTPLDDGSILAAGARAGTWTGTFEGSSSDVFAMAWTPPFGDTLHGAAWGTLTAMFTGWVGGKHGTVTMFFTMQEPANDPVITGTWVILSGTKALKHVGGSGTWVSSGVDPSATYGGTIRRREIRRFRLPGPADRKRQGPEGPTPRARQGRCGSAPTGSRPPEPPAGSRANAPRVET
jgi:hypothetical protein